MPRVYVVLRIYLVDLEQFNKIRDSRAFGGNREA